MEVVQRTVRTKNPRRNQWKKLARERREIVSAKMLVLVLHQSGLVRRPDARPQRRAFLGIGFSSLHEFAGE